MRGLNKVQLIGRAGRAPDLQNTNDGTLRAQFSVAVNRTWNDADGQRQQATEWVNVVMWGKVAEIAGEYLDKGRLVYVEGRLQTRTWQDETSGEKRYYTEVVGYDLVLLDSRPKDDEQADEDAAAPLATTQAAPAPQRHTKAAPAPRRARLTDAQRAAVADDLF